jgi:hypothetical protein
MVCLLREYLLAALRVGPIREEKLVEFLHRR